MDFAQSLYPSYRHTQVSRMTLVALGLGLVIQLGSLARAVRRRHRHPWLVALPIALFAPLIYAFSALTVEIAQGILTVGFRGGLLQRTIALAAVRQVDQVEVPWYCGRGLRLTPKGWLYNVRGRHAVAVGLANGRTVIIGTDEPAELAAAIEAARRELGATAA
jgi:hypothetical protein